MSEENLAQLLRSQQSYQKIPSNLKAQLSQFFLDWNLRLEYHDATFEAIYEILRDDTCALRDLITVCKIRGKDEINSFILHEIHDEIVRNAFQLSYLDKKFTYTVRVILNLESVSLPDLATRCRKDIAPNQILGIDRLYEVRKELIKENDERPVVFHYDNVGPEIPEVKTPDSSRASSVIYLMALEEYKRSFHEGAVDFFEHLKKKHRRRRLIKILCCPCLLLCVCCQLCCGN